jgi:hypothetical protein
MEININIDGQRGKAKDNIQPNAGWPPDDDPLGEPASLEVSFYNLFTKPDPDNEGEYIELITETKAKTVIDKTVTLDKGLYAERKQTDEFHYHRNSYELDADDEEDGVDFYEDNFGPDNPDRFNREPLRPIKTDDPDTDPPNIKDRDDGMRWDGIGVNTPMFHIDVIKDRLKPKTELQYKEDILIRECNPDLAKGIKEFSEWETEYPLPKKYRQIKIKKKEPLTYVINNIWVPKAHLSIEEIESASHCVTGMVYTTGESASPPYSPDDTKYAIDSIEGIFWNKFDTYLCKERTSKDEETVKARYKITLKPSYDEEAYKKPILNFTSGGTLKVEAYMVPRSWLYYGRFYSPAVCEEKDDTLLTQVFDFYFCYGDNEPPNDIHTYSWLKRAVRANITNYTNIFCLWDRPPHDYRLPARNDDILTAPATEDWSKIYTSFRGGFTHFDYDPFPPFYWAYDCGEEYNFIALINYVNPSQCWSGFCYVLHDYEYNCSINKLIDRSEQASRGVLNRGFNDDVYVGTMGGITSGPYGFLLGGMRGLFLYNFSPFHWLSNDTTPTILSYHYLNECEVTIAPLPDWIDPSYVASIWPKDFPITTGVFSLWHKTPSGCVFHRHTRPWINTLVGERYQATFSHTKLLINVIKNLDYQELFGFTGSTPDGGLWKYNSTSFTCGFQYPDTDPLKVQYDISYPEYNIWPACERKAYDGGSVYTNDDITNFQKLWDKFYASTLVKTQKDANNLNKGANASDDIPFVVGVAGAKAESLVAILKVDHRVFYIWRAIDEEEDTGMSIPLLPTTAGTTFEWTSGGSNNYNWYPLFGCGEVWNEFTKFGNIKTAFNTEDSIAPHTYRCALPGLYRIATEIVHQGAEFDENIISADAFFRAHYVYTEEENENAAPGYQGWTASRREPPFPTEFGEKEGDNGPLDPISIGWYPETALGPTITQETLFELDMPVYIMIYREQALGSSSRWGGSYNAWIDYSDPTKDGVVTPFSISAANRNKDSCG